PIASLFPYTTLFRSLLGEVAQGVEGTVARPVRRHHVLAQPGAVDVAEEVVLDPHPLVDLVEGEARGEGGGGGGSGHHRLLRGGGEGVRDRGAALRGRARRRRRAPG